MKSNHQHFNPYHTDAVNPLGESIPENFHPHPKAVGAIELQRAYGPGHGKGEILVKIRDNDSRYLDVLGLFVPCAPEDVIHWSKPVERHDFRVFDHDKYHILEVARSSVCGPVARLCDSRGSALGPWTPLTPSRFVFNMSDGQRASLETFTGLDLGGRRHWEGRRPVFVGRFQPSQTRRPMEAVAA